MAPVLIASS
ncbi:hypothetical protein E2C01_102164 [Portunus trituberculatus]|uniref:Uncharacterized protein n=1 Tax=Portunus trituberculatus TaxID=210409 RepID=A0A5B7KHU5_PORTR|nr:hypothetical protein [Portunus trituberculatus]